MLEGGKKGTIKQKRDVSMGLVSSVAGVPVASGTIGQLDKG